MHPSLRLLPAQSSHHESGQIWSGLRASHNIPPSSPIICQTTPSLLRAGADVHRAYSRAPAPSTELPAPIRPPIQGQWGASPTRADLFKRQPFLPHTRQNCSDLSRAHAGRTREHQGLHQHPARSCLRPSGPQFRGRAGRPQPWLTCSSASRRLPHHRLLPSRPPRLRSSTTRPTPCWMSRYPLLTWYAPDVIRVLTVLLR